MAEQQRLSPPATSLHPFHQLPDELWALVLSKCTWERSWQEVQALVTCRPGAARCLQSRPDLLAQMLTTRGSSTDGLEIAVLRGRVDVATLLLSEHGARADGLALMLAMGGGGKFEQQSTAMVKLLLDHGAIATCAVLFQAVRTWQPCSDGDASSNCRWPVMELLLDAGGMPFVDKALRRAAVAGHDDLVTLLLSRCPSTLARHRALEVAAELGFTRTLGVLLHAVEDQEVIDVALAFSAGAGQLEAATLLLEHGADVSWWDDTALSLAACSGHVSMVEVLLQNGADASRLDPGLVLHFAECGSYAVALLLVKHSVAVPVQALITALARSRVLSVDTNSMQRDAFQQLVELLLERSVRTRAAAKQLLALAKQ